MATAFSVNRLANRPVSTWVVGMSVVACFEDGFDHLATDTGANGSRSGLSIHCVASSSYARCEVISAMALVTGDDGLNEMDGVTDEFIAGSMTLL